MRLTKIAVAAALGATLASQAVAGGFAPIVVEPETPVVVTEPAAPRSSLGIILPLALLGGLVALAVANSDDDPSTPDNNN